MLHGKNQTVYGDCLALSNEFVNKFVNKISGKPELKDYVVTKGKDIGHTFEGYETTTGNEKRVVDTSSIFGRSYKLEDVRINEEIVAKINANKYIVTTGIFEGHIFNGHPVVISGENRIWDDDSAGRSYPAENTKILSETNEASIKISSKQELPKLGYTSVAPGMYICSKHHLWQLSRDGEGYVIERTADEETIRKAKETKTASKKTATVYKVEQTFTIPGFEHTPFSPNEEIETYKSSSPSDKYQTSIIQDMLGREVPVTDTTLSNLITNRYITKIAKTASRLVTKSDMPLDDFSNDLSQSGVYYQKGSSATDIESGKLVTSFEVEDKDLDTFKTIASDYGIIVEANKTAEIEESKKVFSDEAIIRGISLLINMGFTKNEAIKEFIASNELDNEYKKDIENILDKYKI